MNRRLSGADPSLNAKISSDDGSQTEWQDWIEADSPNQEEEYAEKEEDSIRKDLISESLNVLNERELDIVQTRRLSEETTTLEELSDRPEAYNLISIYSSLSNQSVEKVLERFLIGSVII